MLERTGLFIPGAECKLAANGVWPVQEVVLRLVFVQTVMVDLICSLGIKYDFVVGHSIGVGYASGHYNCEMVVGIAAACAAAMVKADGNGTVFALGVGVQKVKMLMHKVMSDAKVQDCGSLELTPHKLSLSLVALAKDPSVMAFAAKLRVSCPFHKLFMEAQEALFKGCVGATPLSQGTKMPIARVMSMTDRKWFECDLDINYFWDNI
ncbi:hypothetical protein SCLCIDRAFT_1149455, partial [Scleroderma citrinum Foug A]